MISTRTVIFGSSCGPLGIFINHPKQRKVQFYGIFGASERVIRTSCCTGIYPTAKTTCDVCSPEFSALYTVSSRQEGPLKNGV